VGVGVHGKRKGARRRRDDVEDGGISVGSSHGYLESLKGRW
jgi:hypothetical protein